MPDIKYEVAPDDDELWQYTKERHSKCILSSLETAMSHRNPADNKGVTLQLNESLNAHAKAARESNILRKQELDRLKEKDEKEKDKISSKIHPTIINMIKMAASEDGETAASSLPEGCKAFLSCTSTGMAEV